MRAHSTVHPIAVQFLLDVVGEVALQRHHRFAEVVSMRIAAAVQLRVHTLRAGCIASTVRAIALRLVLRGDVPVMAFWLARIDRKREIA